MLEWLKDRMMFSHVIDFLSHKTVPRHKHSFWYLFGGLAFFFFVIQLVTGMLLLVYYSPTPNTAYESIQFITNEVPIGWLVRSLHNWSANLMVFSVLTHLFSTFFMKAYRKPRELMWISGVLLLFLVLGFGFTGYLLPWDTKAYFATQIGTEIPRSVPILGDFVVTLLRGGEFVADETLKRLFALHIVILPVATLLLVLFHLILNQFYGSSIPMGTNVSKRGIPFFPNYLYRDLIAWTIGLSMLFAAALLFPVHLSTKADPLASAPLGIKPEWYFLGLYQTLRVVPPNVLGMSGEMIVNLAVLLLGFGLLGVPFLDRRASREEPSPVFTILGAAVLIYLAITITVAYLT